MGLAWSSSWRGRRRPWAYSVAEVTGKSVQVRAMHCDSTGGHCERNGMGYARVTAWKRGGCHRRYTMRAVYYERLGAARDVLMLDEVETPQVGPGEVRVRVHASGINPSDVKRRGGRSIYPMSFPRVIPHQDGAGVIEAV